MSIQIQSPAITGTSPLGTAHDFLAELRPLLPLYVAPNVMPPMAAQAFTAPEVLGFIVDDLLEDVSRARNDLEQSERYLGLGAAYFRADDLVFILEARNESRATLDALEPLLHALTHGAPMAWYRAHSAALGARLALWKERVNIHAACHVSDVEYLFDSLIEL